MRFAFGLMRIFGVAVAGVMALICFAAFFTDTPLIAGIIWLAAGLMFLDYVFRGFAKEDE